MDLLERWQCSLLTDGPSRSQCGRGHFGQHLRQVRERHGDIGQVLGHGAVHDVEEVHRARRGVDCARLAFPKHVAADHDGDLQPLVALCCFSWRRVLGVALCCCSRREVLSVALCCYSRSVEGVIAQLLQPRAHGGTVATAPRSAA